MKRMTPATKLLFSVLKGKYKYFSERKMLASDGSFYCIDKALIDLLGIADNTIRRARIFLKQAREINYVIGKHKGAATRYWIISKGAKMEPFGQLRKEAKMLVKEANLVIKGSQNVTLNNKEVNNDENSISRKISFSEEDKEGIRAFAKLYGAERAVKLLSDKGCNIELIQQVIQGEPRFLPPK